MEFTALNLGLVFVIMLILFVTLGFLIFKTCRQESHDLGFPRKSSNIKEITQSDSLGPSLKNLDANELETNCKSYLRKRNFSRIYFLVESIKLEKFSLMIPILIKLLLSFNKME